MPILIKKPPMEKVTLAAWDGKSKSIIYNLDYGGKGKAKKLQDMLDYLETEGEIPKGCNFPGFITTHECGHAIWSYLNRNHPKVASLIADIILEAAKSGELRKFCKHSTGENLAEAFCDIFGQFIVSPS